MSIVLHFISHFDKESYEYILGRRHAPSPSAIRFEIWIYFHKIHVNILRPASQSSVSLYAEIQKYLQENIK